MRFFGRNAFRKVCLRWGAPGHMLVLALMAKLGAMEIMAELWICGRRDEPMT